MAHHNQEASTHKPGRGTHETLASMRQERILDAASKLILRYGYHKTTVDDIATEAGVGKGTLYLHWKTREELFAALILREKIAMAGDIKQRMTSDPAGATLHGLLKNAALALMQRPLLKAVLLRDTEVFGKFVQREQSSATSAEVLTGFINYLQGLREQGLVRTDLTLHTQASILSSIFLGFLLAAPLLPGTFKSSNEELAEQIAETVHRTLEPRDPAPPGALQVASHNLTQYLDHSVLTAQEQLQVGEHTEREGDLQNAHLTARVRGRKGGRSKKLNTAAKVAEVRRMYADKTIPIEEICSALGISRASLYRYIKGAQKEEA